MTDRPAVSVLLPFRDAEETLPECLDSIAAQTLENFELLAIDDNSGDDSRNLLARRAARDGRIRLLSNPGTGLVAALNYGLAIARADLVARMDADDVMHPERLTCQQTAMLDEPALSVLGTQVRVISAAPVSAGLTEYVTWQNACVEEADIRAGIYVESPFAHPSVCLRRTAIVTAGGYREGKFPEDYELWLRLAQRGARMGKLRRVLLDWRDSPERLSRTDPRCAREAFDRLRARYLARDPRIVTAARRFAIWGAGRRTRRRCRWLLEDGLAPLAWIDIDPRKIGNRLAGVPVVAPDWLATRPDVFVLSYVANHGARELICKQLESFGRKNGVDFLCVG